MTKNWMIYLPVGAAVVLLIGAGYVQGVWSERWGTFPEMQIFSEQLNAIPKEIGEWKGTDREGSDERTKEIAGAVGELVRAYRNSQGEEVRISIICGRLQDISYHTPDRCYPAAGFDMQGDPQREVIDLPNGDEAQFFAVNFTKSEPTGSHSERGYWSWTGDGHWTAPDNTKFAFASQQRAIYKLYVFANIPEGQTRAGERDFCREFMQQFIPALNDALRPAFEKVGRGDTTDTAVAPEAAPEAAKADAPAA
ncbi:MAG: exosortase C-terminal domain/associated protein EpsI [Pirellulales bacterium]